MDAQAIATVTTGLTTMGGTALLAIRSASSKRGRQLRTANRTLCAWDGYLLLIQRAVVQHNRGEHLDDVDATQLVLPPLPPELAALSEEPSTALGDALSIAADIASRKKEGA